MAALTPTRTRPHWLFLAAFGFSLLEVVGGVVLSAATLNGQVIALTSFMAGTAMSLGLWWWTRDEAGKGLAHTLARVSFVGTGGLAFYAIVSYAIWAAGIPIELGIVRDGRMGEHFWLGPFTLVYATVCYVVMKWGKR